MKKKPRKHLQSSKSTWRLRFHTKTIYSKQLANYFPKAYTMQDTKENTLIKLYRHQFYKSPKGLLIKYNRFLINQIYAAIAMATSYHHSIKYFFEENKF